MNPFAVAIVNAIAPGLGYLLIKERVVFGALVLTSTVLLGIVMFTDPSQAFATVLVAVTPTGRMLEGLSYGLGMLAFAYDAYELARRKRLVSKTAAPPVSAAT
jgi:hypothetical protein